MIFDGGTPLSLGNETKTPVQFTPYSSHNICVAKFLAPVILPEHVALE